MSNPRLGDKVTGNYYGTPFVGILTGIDFSGYYLDTVPFTAYGSVRTGLFLPYQIEVCEVKFESMNAVLTHEDLLGDLGTIAYGTLRREVAQRLLALAAAS